MKKTILFGAILTLTMFVVSGFAQDSTMNPGGKMKSSDKKNADSQFMMMAATSGMNEIGLSQTALSKSSNDDVKQFAQKMIDDHTTAGDELKSVAADKNVTLPAAMDAKHQTENDKLSALSGDALDREYAKTMVKDHEQAVATFKKEADSGKDAEAKAFAAKTLPTLQSHLDMARNLMNKMSGGKMDKKMNSKTTDKMSDSK